MFEREDIYMYVMGDEFYSLKILFDLYRSVLFCSIGSTYFIGAQDEKNILMNIFIHQTNMKSSTPELQLLQNSY
jgi:hypothetical protein